MNFENKYIQKYENIYSFTSPGTGLSRHVEESPRLSRKCLHKKKLEYDFKNLSKLTFDFAFLWELAGATSLFLLIYSVQSLQLRYS